MVNRFYRFTTLIFLLFSGFSTSAKSGSYHIDHKNDKKTFLSAATAHHRPYNPYSYELILTNAPSQLLNVQQHRGSHSLPYLYTGPGSHLILVKYLNFICGREPGGLSRFRKLILFPFHDFW